MKRPCRAVRQARVADSLRRGLSAARFLLTFCAGQLGTLLARHLLNAQCCEHTFKTLVGFSYFFVLTTSCARTGD
ncbi:MAG: hypothetical protein BWX48_00751 [Verrucomicrobia bacterium ADurb.Bin006]|nr:MAG: hypothetical protein BWX48_00751 [Verrucomicrobia bacterium ADurb.Bin006]